MLALTHIVQTFPCARILGEGNRLPVEVSLIAQLGHGAGDRLFEDVAGRQKAHENFVDELGEPSARLGGIDLSKGDATSLYSFSVGANGHPFHRHAGHRVFTAISGSAGTQLRFSDATFESLEAEPQSFFDRLQLIDIPPDSLFTVRFGGQTWHQFVPLRARSRHPAFFALSCHTNELGGALPDSIRSQVMANEATIPSLTQLLPPAVRALLDDNRFDFRRAPTIALSLDAPPGSLQSTLCQLVRASSGRLRAAWRRLRSATGFRSDNLASSNVVEMDAPMAGSLLLTQLTHDFDQQDSFSLTFEPDQWQRTSASEALITLLDGFLENRPPGVSRLMAFRNLVVRPFGLRTSPLGCPVSSLLGSQREHLFAGRFPVIDHSTNAMGTHVQVVLGADDIHLRFRSCVGAQIHADESITFTLGTRVHCKNRFGRIYMAMIDRTHRVYVTPSMLYMAAVHATRQSESAFGNAVHPTSAMA